MSNYETQKESAKQQSYKDVSPQRNTVKNSSAYLEDNRPESKKALQMKKLMDNYVPKNMIQPKQNNTGLPDNLKSGIENLSGYSMDDVNVHYNSDKPAQLNAHAYAQGTDIHLASGQEKHLPHEAWHVVQQKQGRVQPTIQMKGVVDINDDDHLEKEADEMGDLSLQHSAPSTNTNLESGVIQNVTNPIQRVLAGNIPVDKNGKPLEKNQVYLIQTGDKIGGFESKPAIFEGRAGPGRLALAVFRIIENNSMRAVSPNNDVTPLNEAPEISDIEEEEDVVHQDENLLDPNGKDPIEEDEDVADQTGIQEIDEDEDELLVDQGEDLVVHNGKDELNEEEDEKEKEIDQEESEEHDPNALGQSYFQGTGVDTIRAKAVFEVISPLFNGKDFVPKQTVLAKAAETPDIDEGKVKKAILYLRKEGYLYPSYPGPNLSGVKNFSLDPSYTEEVGGKKKVDKSLAQAIEKIIATENIVGTNKHDKVRNALIAVITSAPDDPKWSIYRLGLIALFKNDDAAQYYTDTFVRAGDEHEQLITSLTADQVLYDLEHPTNIEKTVSGDPFTSLDLQYETNIATEYIVLKSVTQHSSDHNKVSQNHHPTSKTLISYLDFVDPEKLHGSPGSGKGSSPIYHQELAAKIKDRQTLLELNRELAEINQLHLAGRFDILDYAAKDRVNQIYVQTNGKTLHFNNEKELHRIARNVEVRRRKVLGLFNTVQILLRGKDQALFSKEEVVDIDNDSDKEMDDLEKTPIHYSQRL